MIEPHAQPIDLIHAAGAVVWRGDPHSPEVAVIHRPRYDDWTFPKGKLKPGAHVIEACLREVAEETGLKVLLGRALPPVHYLRRGRLKRVDYWAARVAEYGAFTPNDEVDDLVWLPVDKARERLTFEWDAGLLRALMEAPLVTTPLLFIRHGAAGGRQEWKGDDDRRPLDEVGEAQADDLARILVAYRPSVLVSSPSRRCVQTLKPYALREGLEVRREKLFSETGYDARDSLRLTLALLDSGLPTALCSHGKVLPELLTAVCERRFDEDGRLADTQLRKGAFAVAHHRDGRIVALERYII
jgi:8-oxo-dGTP pyrophosphatase MutT (NUDIX family)/phosphohistidine phosphatase SixA